MEAKFTRVEADVYSVFAQDSWITEEIVTYPSNFPPDDGVGEYIRVAIIASGSAPRLQSTSGVVLIDIFTEADRGSHRPNVIADKLDQYLLGKSLKTGQGTTLFLGSSMIHNGIDRDTKTLFRSTYTINFKFFGEN